MVLASVHRAFSVALGAALVASALHLACGGSTPADGFTEDAGGDTPHLRRDAAASDAKADAYALGSAFVTDPSIWKPVPNPPGCELYEARVVPDPFPKRAWESCGSGCRVADANLSIETFGGVARATSSGGLIGGELYLSLGMGFTTPAQLQTVLRLSDETTIAAVELRGNMNQCIFAAGRSETPFLVSPAANIGPGSVFDYAFGRISSTPGAPIDWSRWVRAAGYSGELIDFDGARGMTFAGGVVSLVQDPSGSSFVEPDAGYAQIGDITSRGRLLAVSRLGWGAGEIQRITADGGVSRLLELAGVNAVALATDDSRLVWVKAAGDAAAMFDGYYGTASIAWATFDGSSLGPIIEGPVLSAAPSVYRSLKIGGDYAATVGCPAVSGAETEPACTLYVVQLSTQKLFVVPPRSENNDFVSVLGVSDAEIVVAEEDYPRRPPFGLIERIVRLSTASLDSLFR